MTEYINDAGHGGRDPGAVAKGNIEKEYTLEATLYVDKRLGDHGITSHCTRSKDETLTNPQRTGKVKKYKKCLSHHYNAGGGTGAEFIHSIYSDGKFEAILEEEFEKEGYPVRRSFSKKGNGGRDYYYMHRETGSCVTTIIEYDFVDGGNAEKIKSKSYREGMYECVVKAVCHRENVKYKPLVTKAPEKKAETKQEGVMYRVVTGSFADKSNAEQRVKELKAKNFDSFIDVIKA